jgi:hypothetical protein
MLAGKVSLAFDKSSLVAAEPIAAIVNTAVSSLPQTWRKQDWQTCFRFRSSELAQEVSSSLWPRF